jgi:hypothetical protein
MWGTTLGKTAIVSGKFVWTEDVEVWNIDW